MGPAEGHNKNWKKAHGVQFRFHSKSQAATQNKVSEFSVTSDID